jgi:dolichol-phosphate mannosyltransferase
MTCSIVLPTYNEVKNIGEIIHSIQAVVEGSEIIIVDDNSPDETSQMVRKLQRELGGIKLVMRREKRGIGSAVEEGYTASSREKIIFMDADFSHNPSDISTVAEKLDQFDVVVCSRFLPGARFEQSVLRTFGTTFLNRFLSKFSRSGIYDLTNGFVGIRRDALKDILEFYKAKNREPFIDLYQLPIVLASAELGLQIIEIPTNYSIRTFGSSKINSLRTATEALRFVITYKIPTLNLFDF